MQRDLFFVKNNKYNTILIVTHGEPIQIIKGYFDNLNNKEMLNITINNCSIHKYKI